MPGEHAWQIDDVFARRLSSLAVFIANPAALDFDNAELLQLLELPLNR
ncbi:hypothetical protein L2137_07120 [Corynebacterium diphtheriae bv. mitis]|nr:MULTISPECIES: hypothetical protein [Corynebacterium]MCM0169610.1 hypothetical protein [Corynebacterium diphtheriae bv. mitis]